MPAAKCTAYRFHRTTKLLKNTTERIIVVYLSYGLLLDQNPAVHHNDCPGARIEEP